MINMFGLLVILVMSQEIFGFAIENRDGKVFGGIEVPINYLPYQAQISQLGMHACGGSIVSRKTIVTAAHCVDDLDGGEIIPGDFIVHVGSAKRTTGGVFRKVASIIIHPNFMDDYQEILNNDIALMKLEKSLSYSTSIQPISLPAADYVIEQDSMVFISGFGSTELSNENFSENLLYAYIPIRNFTECAKTYRMFGKVNPKTQFCAGTLGKDSCQGDSGGPLVQTTKLIGITSFGLGCGVQSYPTVYIKVTNYLDFINANL